MKNSLAGLAAQKAPILTEVTENPTKEHTEQVTPQTMTDVPPVKEAPVKADKPKKDLKPVAEKTDMRVQTMLTKKEAAKLAKKAGDVPMSKYLRKQLIKAGII